MSIREEKDKRLMEITNSCLDKYDVAKVVIKPPHLERDVMDIELVFLSRRMPGLIKGFLTVDKYGEYTPRSYGTKHIPISQSTRKRLRTEMRQLAAQLIGELNDG